MSISDILRATPSLASWQCKLVTQGDLHSLIDLDHLDQLHAQASGTPVDAGALQAAADEALEEERFADAETLIRGALVAAPKRPAAWRSLARLAEAWGEVDVAILALRRAVELGNDEVAALELASLLAGTGAFDEASALAHALGIDAESRWVRARASALADVIEKREARRAKR